MPFLQKDIKVKAGQTANFDIHLSDTQLNTLGDGGEEYVKLIAGHSPPAGRTPCMRDGKPDLSGVWLAAIHCPEGEPPQPLPWAEAIAKQRRERMNMPVAGPLGFQY